MKQVTLSHPYRRFRNFLRLALVPVAALAAWPSAWSPTFLVQHFSQAAARSSYSSFLAPGPGRKATHRVVAREAEGSGSDFASAGWAGGGEGSKATPWWEDTAKGLIGQLQREESTDAIEKLRKQMSLEEQLFDQEIEDVVIAGKRALLRLRMQRAVEMPNYNWRLFKQIRKQIARALTLRRQREIARGITKEQSRRMRRRRKLELKMQYEDAYGSEHRQPRSRKWKRRMGRIL